jgi:hypothetical protein
MNIWGTLGSTLTPKRVTLGIMFTDMIGRPAITLTNTKIEKKTRYLMATREGLTELFGFTLTYIVATLTEKIIPAIYAKKHLVGTTISAEFLSDITKKAFTDLTPSLQKFRGVILGSSFFGAIVAASVLTPLLNNLVLNKVMNRILKSEQHVHEQAIIPSAAQSLAVVDDSNFRDFLKLYLKKKVDNDEKSKINNVNVPKISSLA